MGSIAAQLILHTEWADRLVHDALSADSVASSGAPQETAAPGADGSYLRALLHHLHAVQWVYLHIWRDEPLDVPEPAAFEDLAAVARWGREAHAQMRQLVATLSDDALTRTIDFPWTAMLEERYGLARPATLEETLAQVATHSTYHRGQINRRIRELGGEPPLTDFIAWIWAGKPAP